MYHSNIAALLAQRLSGRATPVLWNVRHSLDEVGLEKRTTRAVIRAGAPLSRFASGIVYNSRVSARQHEAIGYADARTEIIPNGFDTQSFRPDPVARASMRAELGLAPSTVAVGLIARYHAVKDHATLLRAAGLLRQDGADFQLVLAGGGVDRGNAALMTAITAAGIGNRTTLLGERADVPRILAGLDVVVLCSVSEGFPNVLGEAMACGVPCIATDVGDCRFLLGSAGIIVPPSDPFALAGALRYVIRMNADARREAGEIGRTRVVQEFSLPFVAARYERLYHHIVDEAPARNKETAKNRRIT
jgi:glycosyltransferase involved in cell wall biosynthesis